MVTICTCPGEKDFVNVALAPLRMLLFSLMGLVFQVLCWLLSNIKKYMHLYIYTYAAHTFYRVYFNREELNQEVNPIQVCWRDFFPYLIMILDISEILFKLAFYYLF